MLPFDLTFDQVVAIVVASLGAIGLWVAARTRKRGDAESNVMDRLEKMIERGDRLLAEAEGKIQVLENEVESLKTDRDKQNRNITRISGDYDRLNQYVRKHLPGRDDIPVRTELEA